MVYTWNASCVDHYYKAGKRRMCGVENLLNLASANGDGIGTRGKRRGICLKWEIKRPSCRSALSERQTKARRGPMGLLRANLSKVEGNKNCVRFEKWFWYDHVW